MSPAYPDPRRPAVPSVESVEDLLPYARRVVTESEATKGAYMISGYAGAVEPGDRALIVARSIHNEMIVDALTTALREQGVRTDVIWVDVGPDEERTEGLDVDLAITDPREQGTEEVDAYSQFLGKFWWAEAFAVDRGFDLLIQSTAGPFGFRYPDAHNTGEPFYAERLIWQTVDELTSDAPFYPFELLRAIGDKTRGMIWDRGEGATVRITDPEGTDVTYTLFEEYFEASRNGFEEPPAGIPEAITDEIWDEYYRGTDQLQAAKQLLNSANHIGAHPWPPLIEKSDASGTIASTLGHHSKPYPRIELTLQDGRVTDIAGGGEKGDRMRELLERTEDVTYPDFPGPGMFWLFEVSIGTNPKVFRPRNIMMKSEPGTLTERLRSGIVHMGTGTLSTTYSEDWAAEQGIPYGHVDQHLNFPTLEVVPPDGEPITVIEKGRLTALDDPEIRELAAEYGDPDDLLTEDWIPPLPGVNVSGSLEEYSKNPAAYIDEFVES